MDKMHKAADRLKDLLDKDEAKENLERSKRLWKKVLKARALNATRVQRKMRRMTR